MVDLATEVAVTAPVVMGDYDGAGRVVPVGWARAAR